MKILKRSIASLARSGNNKKKIRKRVNLSIRICLLNLVFIILNFPSGFYQYYRDFNSQFDAINFLLGLLFYSQYFFNFLVYLFTMEEFRLKIFQFVANMS